MSRGSQDGVEEETEWDLHVDVATGERFFIHRVTKEVRYHDENAAQQSSPTGKGPRERERNREWTWDRQWDRQRARERGRNGDRQWDRPARPSGAGDRKRSSK